MKDIHSFSHKNVLFPPNIEQKISCSLLNSSIAYIDQSLLFR